MLFSLYSAQLLVVGAFVLNHPVYYKLYIRIIPCFLRYFSFDTDQKFLFSLFIKRKKKYVVRLLYRMILKAVLISIQFFRKRKRFIVLFIFLIFK
jgi:hypothetical protein